MDQFILFGDSITQQCFDQEDNRGFFGPALANHYVRRLDIINRGLSGYNTTQALKVLPEVMPSVREARVRFLLIFFGANDARLPDTPGGPQQHVDAEEFKANLRKIITHPCVVAHEKIRIILVTTPPVEERKLIAADKENYPGLTTMRRTAFTTARYARVVRNLGDALGVPVLDIWAAMTREAGDSLDNYDLDDFDQDAFGSMNATPNAVLQNYLHDGLHFSRLAYELLFKELVKLIEETWPDQTPERLPFVVPAWDDERVWKDGKSVDGRNML